MRVHVDPEAARAVEPLEARRADVLLPWGARRVGGIARVRRVHVDVHVVCAYVRWQGERGVAQARDDGRRRRGAGAGGGGVQAGRRRRGAPGVLLVVVVDEVVREHLVYAREGRHLCFCWVVVSSMYVMASPSRTTPPYIYPPPTQPIETPGI